MWSSGNPARGDRSGREPAGGSRLRACFTAVLLLATLPAAGSPRATRALGHPAEASKARATAVGSAATKCAEEGAPSAGGTSGASCPPCGPLYCIDAAAADREREAKKAQLRAAGYPERLLNLLDQYKCVACIRYAPDSFTILIEFAPGHLPSSGGQPWTHMAYRWTPQEEALARKELREGTIQSFYLMNAMTACACCGEADPAQRADYDASLEMNTGGTLAYQRPEDLGPDPPELQAIPPEQLQQVPPIGTYSKPPMRQVQAHCPACAAAAEEFNDIARWLDTLWGRKVQLQERIDSNHRLIIQGENKIASLGYSAGLNPQADAEQQILATAHDNAMYEVGIQDDQKKLDKLDGDIAYWNGKLKAAEEKLKACEAQPCTPPAQAVPPPAAPAPAPATPKPAPKPAECLPGQTCEKPPAACTGPGCDTNKKPGAQTPKFSFRQPCPCPGCETTWNNYQDAIENAPQNLTYEQIANSTIVQEMYRQYLACAKEKCAEQPSTTTPGLTEQQPPTAPATPKPPTSAAPPPPASAPVPTRMPPPPRLVDLHCPACAQEQETYKRAQAWAAAAYDRYLRTEQEYRTLAIADQSDPGKWEGREGQQVYVPSATDLQLQAAGRMLRRSEDDLSLAEQTLAEAFDAYARCAAEKCQTGPAYRPPSSWGDGPPPVTYTAPFADNPPAALPGTGAQEPPKISCDVRLTSPAGGAATPGGGGVIDIGGIRILCPVGNTNPPSVEIKIDINGNVVNPGGALFTPPGIPGGLILPGTLTGPGTVIFNLPLTRPQTATGQPGGTGGATNTFEIQGIQISNVSTSNGQQGPVETVQIRFGAVGFDYHPSKITVPVTPADQNPAPKTPASAPGQPAPGGNAQAPQMNQMSYTAIVCRGSTYNQFLLPSPGHPGSYEPTSISNIQNGPASGGGPPSATGSAGYGWLGIHGESVGINQIQADVAPINGGESVHVSVTVVVIACDPRQTTAPPAGGGAATNPGNARNNQQPGGNPQAPGPGQGSAPPGNNPNPGDQPPPQPPPPGGAPHGGPVRPPDFKHAVPTGENSFRVTICRGTSYVLPIHGGAVDVGNIQNGASPPGGAPSATGQDWGNGLKINGLNLGTNEIQADVIPRDGGNAVHLRVQVTVIDCDQPTATVPGSAPPETPLEGPSRTTKEEGENPAGGGLPAPPPSTGFFDVLSDNAEIPGGEGSGNTSVDANSTEVDLSELTNPAAGAATETGVQLLVVILGGPDGSAAAATKDSAKSAEETGRGSRGPEAHGGARAGLRLAAYRAGTGTERYAEAREPANRGVRSAGAAGGGPAGSYSIISNGRSSGEALELRVRDASGKLRRIRVREGMVLEAVKHGAPKPVGERGSAGTSLHTTKLSALCLEFEKPPPDEGIQYRVAPRAVQQEYRPIRGVLRAGREAAAAGKFHPDSDPKEYAETIQQYALWAKLGNWDQQKFAQMFLERSRKNAEAMNVKWTKQLEQALLGLAPNRWNDISMVLQQVEKMGQAGPRGGRK